MNNQRQSRFFWCYRPSLRRLPEKSKRERKLQNSPYQGGVGDLSSTRQQSAIRLNIYSWGIFAFFFSGALSSVLLKPCGGYSHVPLIGKRVGGKRCLLVVRSVGISDTSHKYMLEEVKAIIRQHQRVAAYLSLWVL